MVKFALVEKQCAVFLRKKTYALARILLKGRKKCTKLQQYKGPGIAKKKNAEEIITLTEKPGL